LLERRFAASPPGGTLILSPECPDTLICSLLRTTNVPARRELPHYDFSVAQPSIQAQIAAQAGRLTCCALPNIRDDNLCFLQTGG
jgi:hypothetical protein